MNDFKIILEAVLNEGSASDINKQINIISKNLSDIPIRFDLPKSELAKIQKEMDALMDSMYGRNYNTKSVQIDSAIKEAEVASKRYSSQLKEQMQQRVKDEDAAKKQALAQEKLNFTLEEWKKLQNSRLDGLSTKSGINTSEVERLRSEINKVDVANINAGQSMKSLSNDVTALGRSSTQTSNSMGSMVAQYFTLYELFNATKRMTSDMLNVLFSVDEQMIELKKVTDETTASYDRFLTSASKMGIELASTTDDVIAATANFAKLGADSFEQAQQLAEVALIYANVADGLNATDASKSIVATMSAFRIEAENAIEIVDKANEVSNRYAIDSKGIADALSVSSNALANANNDLASSIALITTANTTAQDPSRVGNAMKTISLNLRAVSEESGKAIAGMREYIQTIADVDIMADDTTFKSTYDIILELSKKWDSFTDLVQADIATTLSGKHRTDVFLSLMNSADQLESVYNTAMDSTGSATREMEARMQGLDAKLNQVKVSFEQLSLTTINSDFVKGTLDATSSLLQFLDATGGLIPVATSVVGLITTIKSQNIAGSIVATGKSIGALSSNIVNSRKAMIGFGTSMNTAKTATIGFGTALNVAVPIIGLLATGLSLVSMGISKYNADMEELRQKNIEMVGTLSQEQDKLRDLQYQYQEASAMTDDSIEKKKELERIQQILVDSFGSEASGIDIVNGKYNEQIGAIQELIGEKSQLQQILAQQNLDDAKNRLGDATDNSWNFDVSLKANPESIEKAFNDVKTQFGDKFESMVVKNPFGENAATTTMWKINTKDAEEYNDILMSMMFNMQKYGANNSDLFSTIMKNGEDYANTLSDINDMEYAKIKSQAKATIESELNAKAITNTTNATKEQYEAMKSDVIRRYSGSIGDASENQKLLAESLRELDKVFPQFSSAIKDSDDKAKSQGVTFEELQEKIKDLQDTYSDTTSAMKDLKSIQEEYDKYGKISQSSMNSIVSKYPELLSAMGDEGKFREMLIERIDEQKSAQETALTEITLLQNQYAQDIKQIDSQLYEELLQYYQTYSENYADAMEGSVEAWGKMSQAQADITTTLIDNLGIAWKSYFSAIAQGFDALGSSISVIGDNKITHQSDFTEDQWNSLSGIEKQQIENMKETVRTTTEAGKQFSAIGEALSNVMSSFDSGGIEISIPVETSLDDKKSGSKKDDTAKKIKDKLQAELDKIQKPRLELDYEIDILNAKLDTATLKNDQKSIEIINKQLADLLNKRKELTATQNVELGSLKTKFTDETSLKEINGLMEDNSKEWWKDLNNIIQKNIDVINSQKDAFDKQLSKYDLDIEQQQSKLSILQLQNGEVNEQVDLYKSLSSSYLEQQYYIEESLKNMYSQRSTLNESSKEYELITQNILDYENKLVDAMKSQADVKSDLIDLAHEQMEIELEKAIYGSSGKDEWKKDNDDKIQALQDELYLIESQAAAKKKKEEAEKRELELQQLKDKLANLRNQKTQQEYRKQADGSYQWEYVADKQAIADVEKEIADKQVEIEKAAEEQKLEDKKQSIQNQISQLQNLEKAKEESYTRSLEDLKLAMENEKFAWTLNGEEVSGIVETALTNVSGIYDVKMSDILSNVQSKLDSIRDAFDSAMNMANNMPSGGSSSGGDSGSSNTNVSDGKYVDSNGKVFHVSEGGDKIYVSRPDGTSSTVSKGDPMYDKTVDALEDTLSSQGKKYANGGLVSHTGLAWVDGTKSNPERMLSASENKAYEIGMKNIPLFNETMQALFDLATPQVSRLKTPTINPTSPNVSFGDINLPNVKDARGFANEVREVVNDMFSGLSNQAKLIPVN